MVFLAPNCISVHFIHLPVAHTLPSIAHYKSFKFIANPIFLLFSRGKVSHEKQPFRAAYSSYVETWNTSPCPQLPQKIKVNPSSCIIIMCQLYRYENLKICLNRAYISVQMYTIFGLKVHTVLCKSNANEIRQSSFFVLANFRAKVHAPFRVMSSEKFSL